MTRHVSVSSDGQVDEDIIAELRNELSALGFVQGDGPEATRIRLSGDVQTVDFERGIISPAHEELGLIEQFLRCLDIDFDSLTPFVEGESKELRLLTEKTVIERFKPTVYSYTHNRYGVAEGSGVVRVQFSAALFRRMARELADGDFAPESAFLGMVWLDGVPALVQRRVHDSNLEVRVKRYHIGSPLHRYLYTERHPTTQSCGPLQRWSRFDRPVVCFDWRHPLTDDDGNRLADEPISDDYAGIWVEDARHAKEMIRRVFLWLESMMRDAGLVLVDFCVFIDRSGRVLFGEISPDCMRVREAGDDIDAATSFDKDIWRAGGSGKTIQDRYVTIHTRLFGELHAR